MLFAGGERRLGSARVAWTLAFSESIWWMVVERDGLVHDTRWMPGARGGARPQACVVLLLDGTFEVHAPGAKVVEAPAAFVLTEEQIEGAESSRSLTYRTDGEPFASIHVHLPAAMIAVAPSVDPSSSPRTFDLETPAWSAAREVAVACRSSAEASLEPMQRLMGLLVQCGILHADATRSVLAPTRGPLALLWRGIRPMVERLYLAPTVGEVSTSTGISVRQVDRHVNAFLARFAAGVGGEGWRPATRHLRLKAAVLFLSAEGISIADVARATSYGSIDAMARAFRDAGLPTPSKVQAELRAKSP